MTLYRVWISSVGQNLQTSTYIWETLFAVLISICGLLLFLYFIGNLQTSNNFSSISQTELVM
ncbi:cyclic nucleotide-gated ion channel 1 [Quercus suber]|uniref:Cyclic nucleotide-gated ion channel 1 n=1 Tax=Quercus suber TaxID=58331 RepID=A0AAW0LRW3_QUESU